MMSIIDNILNKVWPARFHIVADPTDNSITFSERLFRYIQQHATSATAAQAYVFRIPKRNTYAFVISPETEQELWPLCNIQVSDEYHTVGFESICPTVNRICYEYGLPHKPCRLSVHIKRIKKRKVYIIQRPKQ